MHRINFDVYRLQDLNDLFGFKLNDLRSESKIATFSICMFGRYVLRYESYLIFSP